MREKIIHWVLLAVLLLVAGFVRFRGLMWGDYQYQHPDERFLVWVTADIRSVEQPGDYFHTAKSTLNPANRGHGFFVYGTLPLFLTRYLVEAAFRAPGWQEILQVGRALSAASDLLSVLLVYLAAARLLGRRLALLAGWFSALAVLPIQQSHFFTVDSFAAAFSMLAIYLAVRMVSRPGTAGAAEERSHPGLLAAAGFGAAVGLAMASKLNTFPVALLLPAALLLDWLRKPPAARSLLRSWNLLVVGGLAAFLVFRICQPYAFQGPTFFHIMPDPDWVNSIQEQRAQAAGDVDFPPALQWARRPIWFSFENLTLWGLGLPLGLAAWGSLVGLGVALGRRAWRYLRAAKAGAGWAGQEDTPWSGLALVWGWSTGYFAWQSLAWNATMRYQLPIYPTLAILAAWGLGALWYRFRSRTGRAVVGAVGGLVAVLSLAWALAFLQIYLRTETRQAASLWIYNNVPGPVNLEIDSPDRPVRQLLPVEPGLSLSLNRSYRTTFSPSQPAWLAQIDLPFSRLYAGDDPELDARIVARVLDLETGDVIAASVARLDELSDGGRAQMVFQPVYLQHGQRYGLDLHLTSLGGALTFRLDGQIQLRMYARQALVEEGQYTGMFSALSSGTVRRVRLMVINLPARLPDQLRVRTVDGGVHMARLSRAAGATAPLFDLDPPLAIDPGALYLGTLEADGQLIELPFRVQVLDGAILQSLPATVHMIEEGDPLAFTFRPQQHGVLRAISLWRAIQEDPQGSPAVTLELTLADTRTPAVPLLRASQQVFQARTGRDPRGETVVFRFDQPLQLSPYRSYIVRLKVTGAGSVAIRGSAPVNETDWDMGLPFRSLGYDGYNGLYQRGLNLQMYWNDNPEKLQRFIDTLNQADYLFISSNRQWGTTTRLPERYPLTTEYYRRLLGCPPDKDVVWCYRVAEPGGFEGELGFKLVQVFTSYPGWGQLAINTQFAEEAFTVYDHPKVLIFQKEPGYDPERVRAVLSAIDLDNVVHLTPRKAADWSSLMLPAARWAVQQAGGTWAQLFPPAGLHNRLPLLAAGLWWLFLAGLGWLAYPLVRLALPGLHDRGYPLARMAGLLLLAYPAWLAGSLGVAVTPALVLAALLLLAVPALALAWYDRRALAAELRERRAYLLGVEGLALLFFLAFLGVRAANPDLWHVVMGGEKPMDFSYFNAVLKSSTFPPYDPWFAGGLMNYYYYGFVIYGLPVKLLGITPSIAYNLLLPAQFSLVALSAFSIGWNLLNGYRNAVHGVSISKNKTSWHAGLLAAFLLLVLGNLGTVRMVWQGWQRLAASQEQIAASGALQRAAFAWQGLQRSLAGQSMAYYPGDWYWIPSRAIQPGAAGEITEYPFFSFLYGDPHAHLMALPVTLLVLAWALSVMLSAARWNGRLGLILGMGLGALAVGSLRAANTWDYPTYLALAAAGLVYGTWQDASRASGPLWRRGLRAVLLLAALLVLSAVLYQPFADWFRPGYSELKPWSGLQTNISSYLVHWGLFLWILTAWLVQEMLDWMAATPLSKLGRLRCYQPYIAASGVVLGAAWLYLLLRGVQVAWLVVPLGITCLALLLRPGQLDGKRAVLFLAGSGLALTLLVEVFALQGDRMNTVFKFYFQAWTMLSISAAAGLAWLLPRLRTWQPGLRAVWLVVVGLLALGCAANTVVAARAKVTDRMSAEAPAGLDGMAYMATARMFDGPPGGEAREMDLAQDYRAISWMQNNVAGSPVIVEMHTGEYRHWGSRFTIYTGLPGVIGWQNHQRQQRPTQGDWITRRIEDVREFYLTADREQAAVFLQRYQVEYVILGQLERVYAPGPGLAKFRALEGDLWERVYTEGETEIYRVNH